MQAEPDSLPALVREVARFPIRDRRVRREQDRMQRTLRGGGTPAEADVRRYLAALERYFSAFEREARARLRDLDGRLAKVAQLQFNLTAERGVATRRVEVTRSVLASVAALDRR